VPLPPILHNRSIATILILALLSGEPSHQRQPLAFAASCIARRATHRRPAASYLCDLYYVSCAGGAPISIDSRANAVAGAARTALPHCTVLGADHLGRRQELSIQRACGNAELRSL